MDTTALIQRVKDLLSFDLDFYVGESPTDAQVVAGLNDELYLIGKEIEQYDPLVTFTIVASQADYDMRDIATPVVSKRMIRVYDVIINGNYLRDASGRGRGLWTMQELTRRYPTWTSDGAATPTKAVRYTGTRILLHPKPTAETLSGGSNYVSGTWLPAALSTSTGSAEPQIPLEIHSSLAVKTACKFAEPMASETHQFNKLNIMRAQADAEIQRVRKDNKDAQSSWGTTSLRDSEDYLQL